MELLATLLLFATLASALTLAGARFWARPKAALERITSATAAQSAQLPGHPSLVFREMLGKLGSLLPASPKDATRMQRRLIRAGYRGPNALKVLYGWKVTLAAGLPLAMAAALSATSLDSDRRLAAVAASGAAGFLLPNEFVKTLARRRQRAIRRGLPNALDLLVVCVESGLGLDQGIMQCAKELEHAHPEISQEFALVNLELKAGKRRVEALRNLADRTSVEELKKLVAVLIQADRFGTSVAQSLRGHSDYMRVQSRQKAEEKAAKLGVKLVFPIFFCILPSLFVVTVGPVAVRIVRDVLPMMKGF